MEIFVPPVTTPFSNACKTVSFISNCNDAYSAILSLLNISHQVKCVYLYFSFKLPITSVTTFAVGGVTTSGALEVYTPSA